MNVSMQHGFVLVVEATAVSAFTPHTARGWRQSLCVEQGEDLRSRRPADMSRCILEIVAHLPASQAYGLTAQSAPPDEGEETSSDYHPRPDKSGHQPTTAARDDGAEPSSGQVGFAEPAPPPLSIHDSSSGGFTSGQRSKKRTKPDISGHPLGGTPATLCSSVPSAFFCVRERKPGGCH